jgi:hypothetical protein
MGVEVTIRTLAFAPGQVNIKSQWRELHQR